MRQDYVAAVLPEGVRGWSEVGASDSGWAFVTATRGAEPPTLSTCLRQQCVAPARHHHKVSRQLFAAAQLQTWQVREGGDMGGWGVGGRGSRIGARASSCCGSRARRLRVAAPTNCPCPLCHQPPQVSKRVRHTSAFRPVATHLAPRPCRHPREGPRHGSRRAAASGRRCGAVPPPGWSPV